MNTDTEPLCTPVINLNTREWRGGQQKLEFPIIQSPEFIKRGQRKRGPREVSLVWYKCKLFFVFVGNPAQLSA